MVEGLAAGAGLDAGVGCRRRAWRTSTCAPTLPGRSTRLALTPSSIFSSAAPRCPPPSSLVVPTFVGPASDDRRGVALRGPDEAAAVPSAIPAADVRPSAPSRRPRPGDGPSRSSSVDVGAFDLAHITGPRLAPEHAIGSEPLRARVCAACRMRRRPGSRRGVARAPGSNARHGDRSGRGRGEPPASPGRTMATTEGSVSDIHGSAGCSHPCWQRCCQTPMSCCA